MQTHGSASGSADQPTQQLNQQISQQQFNSSHLQGVNNVVTSNAAQLGNKQYEYPIGAAASQHQMPGSSGNNSGGSNAPGGPLGPPGGIAVVKKQVGSSSLPKRTPHSELTSYQSEKRLKEYKQQQ